jgi:hypothetical protein
MDGGPTSRWLTRHFLLWCTNSGGWTWTPCPWA